jgi:hypothetical protein
MAAQPGASRAGAAEVCPTAGSRRARCHWCHCEFCTHFPVDALHVWPLGHGGQVTMLPQPSLAVPHWMPWAAHDLGAQVPASGAPHWPGTPPPPHVCGGVHVPQLGMRFPQPSPAGPH